MKLIVKKFFDDDPGSDLYVIERAVHDGREWWEPWLHGRSYCKSSRICGYGGVSADIEGSPREMSAIACAIRCRAKVSFTRCEVDARQEPVTFGSPRNDGGVFGSVTWEEAEDLADQIELMFGSTRGSEWLPT